MVYTGCGIIGAGADRIEMSGAPRESLTGT
jgi:hypothetical protein